MWLKLLKIKSLRDALEPRLVKGRWHPPLLNGRNRAQLRKLFIEAEVPWVFEKKHDPTRSAYNRMPKRIFKEFDNQERILQMRAALKNSEQNIQKYREEKVKNRPFTGIDKVIESVIPAVLRLEGQRKKKLGSGKEVGMRKQESEGEESIYDFSDMKTVKRGKQNVGSKGGRIKSKQRDFLRETTSIIKGGRDA